MCVGVIVVSCGYCVDVVLVKKGAGGKWNGNGMKKKGMEKRKKMGWKKKGGDEVYERMDGLWITELKD